VHPTPSHLKQKGLRDYFMVTIDAQRIKKDYLYRGMFIHWDSKKPLDKFYYWREAIANEIIAKVCTYYNITNEEIRGKKRYRTLVMARHMSMYLIRTRVKLKLKSIGDLFGRDHSTVMHGIASIQDQSDVDELVSTDIENLINIL
jgi:hypothetical protein